ncbi:hypothetical protein [Streptomyces brasiliscabiei]|uniref:hypothetical protein n=1 Tax=Streptomyces brasiliscabiei TaxID=2736302 RepID=UPI001C11A6C7|nr:hypothetical protein [Streptomyces brasiliscabiei]
MPSKKARNPVAPRTEELLAATIVNSVLDTHTIGCDDNTEEGKVDFDLAPRGERAATIALEVSSHRDSKLLAVWNSLDKEYRGQVLPNLSKGWSVEFTSASRVRGAAARRLATLLADFEARRVDRVSVRAWEDQHDWSAGLPDAQHASDVTAIRDLGINAVAQIGESPDVAGRVFYWSLSFGGGSSTADDVPPYVEEFLASSTGANKIKKLGEVKHLETHLFLWADSTHLNISFALDSRVIPPRAPRVPAEIQVVWLSSLASVGSVYQWDRDDGWRIHDVASVSSINSPA